MKTLLLPTDFSAGAKVAVEYGYNLAKQVKANVILCNAVTIPAETPQAGLVVWPMEEHNILMDGSSDELKQLKAELEGADETVKPSITCISEPGTVSDVINNIIAKNKIDLVIMGTHGRNGLSGFILGNHASGIIDTVNKPLLLVPASAEKTPIKKIAFALDFKHPDRDVESLFELLPLIKSLNAKILLAHICDEKDHSPELAPWLTQFLTEISNKANYPHFYYRLINNKGVEEGLDWLCEHGDIDLLAMVHRPHGFFDKLLNNSHTQKMAAHVHIPLLVLPAKK
jgi:nucleotide-binding universal stress UspA family protein